MDPRRRVLCAVGPVEPDDEALAELVRDIQTKQFGAELLVTLKKLALPSVNFDEAKALAHAAAGASGPGRSATPS